MVVFGGRIILIVLAFAGALAGLTTAAALAATDLHPRDEHIDWPELWGRGWATDSELEFEALFDSWMFAVWSSERPPAPTETFAVLLALLKCNPHRDWIESMFLDADREKKTARLGLYGLDENTHPLRQRNVDLARTDLPEYVESPLLQGKTPPLEIEAALKGADIGPVLVALQAPVDTFSGNLSWSAVMTVQDNAFELGSIENTGFAELQDKEIDIKAGRPWRSPIMSHQGSVESYCAESGKDRMTGISEGLQGLHKATEW